MKSVGLIALMLIVLLLMNGCIRTKQDIEKEDCNEYSGSHAKISCIKFKSSYFAIEGETKKAVEECKKIKKVYGKGIIPLINPSSYIATNMYNDCIDEVAYYTADKKVCQYIDEKSPIKLYKIVMKFFGSKGDINQIKNQRVRECEEHAKENANLEKEIKDGFKYIGFKI